MGDIEHRRAASIRRFRWALFGVLALVLLILAVEARHRERADLDDRVAVAERSAEDRAIAAFSALTVKDTARPMLGPTYREVIIPVQAEVMTDPGIARVRVWSTDGTLLFSTDERETIGKVRLADDLAISTALEGRTTSRLVTIPYRLAAVGPGSTTTDLLQTFSPLHVSDRVSVQGAVETDQFWEPIRAEALSPWRTVQVALLALATLSAAVAIALLRVRVRGATTPATDEDVEYEGVEPEGARETETGMASSPTSRETIAHSGQDLADTDLVRDASLAALEQRVGAAERRAQEAEHRLQQLSDQVAATPAFSEPSMPSDRNDDRSPPPVDPAAATEDPVGSAAGRPETQAAELRARLARTAARKKPGGSNSEN
jgi:hypothetical protein